MYKRQAPDSIAVIAGNTAASAIYFQCAVIDGITDHAAVSTNDTADTAAAAYQFGRIDNIINLSLIHILIRPLLQAQQLTVKVFLRWAVSAVPIKVRCV